MFNTYCLMHVKEKGNTNVTKFHIIDMVSVQILVWKEKIQ